MQRRAYKRFLSRITIRAGVSAVILALLGCGGSSTTPPPSSLTFIGGTTATIVGGAGLPATNGLAKPTDTVQITTFTSPEGSGSMEPSQTVSLVYSTDAFASRITAAMQFVQNGAGSGGNQTQWQASLGPFPVGTEVLYFVTASAGGTTLADNNGGKNFEFNIPWVGSVPTTPPFAILQWFATPWRQIQARLPEVVQAGYNTLYLPPPEKAATGSASVGFDPFDRFDLGDRFQQGSVRTQYGTTQELLELVDAAHQLGLRVCFDTVTNHNANRSSNVEPSGYPNQIPEDFHFQGTSGQTITDFTPFGFQIFNDELLGLVDLAQEDGNVVTPPAPPATPGVSLNAQQKPAWIRQPRVPQYYPGGTPVSEDIRQYLSRWGEWLGQVAGADCFRLDAAKHISPPFFGGTRTFTGSDSNHTVYNVTSAPQLVGALDAGVLARTSNHALTFGEIFSSDPPEFAAYAKTGMNLLDYTLTNNAQNVFNPDASGNLGNLGLVLGNTPSGASGIAFEYGGMDPTIGLNQVHNHDVALPTAQNLAYAYLLTRAGQSIVYYDGNNLPPNNNFPKNGRSDALGNGDSLTVTLVEAHSEYARGEQVNDSVSPALYIYERQVSGQAVLLVALNDSNSPTPATQKVVTGFQSGDALVDITGQEPPLTVAPDRSVTLTVPSNFSSAQTNNGTGYVLYAIQNPQGIGTFPITVSQNGTALVPQTFPTANGNSFSAPVVTQTMISFQLATDSTAGSAVVRLDGGGSVLAGRAPITGSLEGLSDGFVAADGSGGSFSITGVDLSKLNAGRHVVEFRAFRAQAVGRPPVFKSFRQVFIYEPPPATSHTVDGILSDFPNPPVTTQTVSTSLAGHEALNQLLVDSDNNFLYLGVVGLADANESASNLYGLVLWLDVDYGSNTGLTSFLTNVGNLDDDSGPAARLASALDSTGLSTATAPPPGGFAPDFVIASFRGGELSSVQALTTSGGQRILGGLSSSRAFGNAAGSFLINTATPHLLQPIAAQIAWDPGTVAQNGNSAQEAQSTGGPGNGMEIALPLATLFPTTFTGNGIPASARLAVYAYIVSTGETGQILASTDPNRVTLGGRPRFRGTLVNQVLKWCQSGCI